MRPIVLIGMMGSGKTTIGKKLAMDLNLSWVDTDLYIENTKHQSIFSKHKVNLIFVIVKQMPYNN